MAAGASSTDMSEPGGEVPALERVVLSDGEISTIPAGDWPQRWKQQEAYVTSLERRYAQQEGQLDELHKALDKARGTVEEVQQRERLLVRRLTAKEQETHDLVVITATNDAVQ